MRIYNAKDGWTFERLENGDISVEAYAANDSQYITFTADEWVSIVTHTAKVGDAETHAIAERLHKGPDGKALMVWCAGCGHKWPLYLIGISLTDAAELMRKPCPSCGSKEVMVST